MIDTHEGFKNHKNEGLITLDLQDVAYIKAVTIGGQKLHAVHAADGTQLTILPERDQAFAAVRQHDMRPMSVH